MPAFNKLDHEAKDHSGQTRIAHPRVPERAEAWAKLQMMAKPEILQCPECRSEEWRVLADDTDSTSLMALLCRRCGAIIPPMEMHVPRMEDTYAKRLGISVPRDGLMKVQFDVDVPNR